MDLILIWTMNNIKNFKRKVKKMILILMLIIIITFLWFSPNNSYSYKYYLGSYKGMKYKKKYKYYDVLEKLENSEKDI